MGQRVNNMAALIRVRFQASGMSIKQLADRSGVYYSAVHGFINGDRGTNLSTAEKLCRVLGLELRPIEAESTKLGSRRTKSKEVSTEVRKRRTRKD